MDAKQLADVIVAGFPKPVSFASTAGQAAPVQDFCKIWPQAKPLLSMVAGLIVAIPGAGATAGAVLNGLVKLGDQVAAQACKT